MELNEFIKLISKRKETILSLVFLFLIVGVVLTAVQPFKYGSKSKLLIVQNNTAGVDPYVISKSNEYLSNVLATVASSNSFFDEVLNSGFPIDQSYFSGRDDQRMKKWMSTVDVKAVNDSGIIEVNVYHKDKNQAGQIAAAVNYVLKTKNNLYYGGGDNVSVKVIDQPIVSQWPVKPNVILNLSLALALGLFFSLGFIYLFPESKYKIKLWPTKSIKVKNISPLAVPVAVMSEAANEEPETTAWENVNNSLGKSLDEQAYASVETPVVQEASDSGVASKLTYDDIINQGDIKNIF